MSGASKSTASTSGDSEPSSFTLQNDDIPPGMEEHVPSASSYGVSAASSSSTSAPSSYPASNPTYASGRFANIPEVDEPDIHIDPEFHRSYSGVRAEDGADNFFNDEEMALSAKLITPASSEYPNDEEAPSNNNNASQQEPDVVMGEAIYGNDDNGLFNKPTMTFWKLMVIALFSVAIVLVLVFTPLIDEFTGGDGGTSNFSSSGLDGTDGNISPTSAPVPAIPTAETVTDTPAPVSLAPTTHSPVSSVEPTPEPSTASPATAAPVQTTGDPPATPKVSTFAPTAASPVTAAPTTAAPVQSSTPKVSTFAPTTANPVTVAPTTAAPVTSAPTTAAPATSTPTAEPPTVGGKEGTLSPTPGPSSAAPTTSPTRAPTSAAPIAAPSPTTPAPTSLFVEFEDTAQDKLLTSSLANMEFGTSVSLSDDGTIMAVGSRDNVVQVYKHNGAEWVEQGLSVIGGPNVVLSGDGLVFVAGTPDHNSQSGQITTFAFDGSKWVSRGSTLAGTTRLGQVMALSRDGSVLVASEPLFNQETGRVTRWEYRNNDWVEINAFAPLDAPSAGDRLGSSLSLSPDGTTVAIGREGANNAAGQVHVYGYNSAGGTSSVGDTVSGSQNGEGMGHRVIYHDEGSAALLMTLTASGQAAISRLNGGGNKWQIRFSSPFPTEMYSEISLGMTSGGTYTAALAYMTCSAIVDLNDPCLANGQHGHVRLLSTSNINQWPTIVDDALQDIDDADASLLNGQALSVALSQNTNRLAAGFPGSNASGAALSGRVRAFRRSGSRRR